MSIGTVMGSTRRGPRSRRVSQPSRRVHTPPMPVPKATASRSPSTSAPSRPASFQASRAATVAIWVAGSWRFCSTLDRTSEVGTASSAAKVTGSSYFSTQSCSMVRAPETPCRAWDQKVGTSPPMGVVAPRPVITAVRVMGLLPLGLEWGSGGGVSSARCAALAGVPEVEGVGGRGRSRAPGAHRGDGAGRARRRRGPIRPGRRR